MNTLYITNYAGKVVVINCLLDLAVLGKWLDCFLSILIRIKHEVVLCCLNRHFLYLQRSDCSHSFSNFYFWTSNYLHYKDMPIPSAFIRFLHFAELVCFYISKSTNLTGMGGNQKNHDFDGVWIRTKLERPCMIKLCPVIISLVKGLFYSILQRKYSLKSA